jgi:hypothetical protein
MWRREGIEMASDKKTLGDVLYVRGLDGWRVGAFPEVRVSSQPMCDNVIVRLETRSVSGQAKHVYMSPASALELAQKLIAAALEAFED